MAWNDRESREGGGPRVADLSTVCDPPRPLLGSARRAIGAAFAITAVAFAVTVALPAAPAFAAEPPPKAEQKKAAAAAFNRGEKAYSAGRFADAGGAFEEAFSYVPHPSALWNAARAWNRAGELARAANLYARYLNEAPDDAPDRKSATKSLAQLAPKLGRLNIQAPGIDTVEIDGEVAQSRSVYVLPGSHVVRGRANGNLIQRVQAVDAGAVASVALVEEAVLEARDDEALDDKKPLDQRDKATTKNQAGLRVLPPAVVIAGGAATAIALGVTIGSGVDTLNARSTFDAAPTTENLAAGQGKQTRTNVLLGVTLGLAALTGAAAIFFVDWGGSPRAARSSTRIGLGLGTAHLAGSF